MEYNKEKPLRVMSSFSGYDSQCMSLDRLKEHFPEFDYTLVGWSEIDKYAIMSHNAVYPQWADRNFGDISKINWDEVPEFDLFTMSSPCFVAGTMVHTEDGFKPIEDITFIDKVLTHTCTYQRVVRTMRREYKGDVYTIGGMSMSDVVCTANHPFYARKSYHYGHIRKRGLKEPEWVEAKNLSKEYYLGYAINQKSELPTWTGCIDNRWGHGKLVNRLSEMFENPTFWYVMGRYVGDGWRRTSKTGQGNGIVICCSDRNEETLKKALDKIGFHYIVVQERTVKKIQICSNELNSFVLRYGYKAHGKRVDEQTLNLPIRLLKGFIDGIMESDGCVTNGYNSVTSVSKELILGLGAVVAKVYNRPFSIYFTERPKKTVIEGRTVNQRDSLMIRWKDNQAKQDHAFYEAGYIWFPISKIEKENRIVDVFNMEVEKDNSYTANGAIVHNCQDFSNAGLQRGGEEGSGTRSSLLWECRKAILAKKPKYIFFENVKALTSKKFLPYFQKWQRELEEYGYNNYAKVLNTKDFGLPQNRERIFMISIRKDVDKGYSFPKPFPLEKKLGDVLEKNVDESYYLSDERIRGLKLSTEKQSGKGNGFAFKPKTKDS